MLENLFYFNTGHDKYDDDREASFSSYFTEGVSQTLGRLGRAGSGIDTRIRTARRRSRLRRPRRSRLRVVVSVQPVSADTSFTARRIGRVISVIFGSERIRL
jgi:hypothetical protein